MDVKDSDLKLMIIDKDEAALKFIIDKYSALVRFISRKYISDEESIEECVSDVFLGVWNNIDSFDFTKNSFKKWIASITRYKVIDYYRKIAREEEVYNILERSKKKIKKNIEIVE